MLQQIANKLASFLPQTRIVQKLFIGYILIILAPMMILGYFLYNQVQNRFQEEYARSRQDVVERSYSNLKVDLAQVESVYQLYQYNPNVTDYLSGSYENEAAYAYTLLKHIRPLFSYVYAGNADIVDIKLYSNSSRVFPIRPEIYRSEELVRPEIQRHEARELLPGQGLWYYAQVVGSSVPQLTYLQNIYNPEFSRIIGTMQVEIRTDVMLDFVDRIKTSPDDQVMFLSSDNALLYGDEGAFRQLRQPLIKIMEEREPSHFYLRPTGQLGYMIYIEPLDMRLVLLSNESNLFQNIRGDVQWLVFFVAICLLTLSTVYYWIASSLTRRILELARHMRRVDSDNLSAYVERTGEKDEINFLASSYNAMLERIDELVNTVHREELMRKEADYMVLQAQVKPHFLYNTLESIRMLAEVNDAPDVADFTHTFGKLIRYSLSSDKNETRLREELEHVNNYLIVQMMRLGDRLQYRIEAQPQIREFVCPRFILQPLVENAIVHGLGKLRRQGMLVVEAVETEHYIKIRIEDNGLGIDEERLRTINEVLKGNMSLEALQTDTGGIGLYNVHERLKSYYGYDSGVTIDSRLHQGTICVLHLRKGGV